MPALSPDARTVPFLDLLRGTAHRCGLDPDALANTEAAALAEHLTFAARKAWRAYDWPDAMRTEPRAFRDVFELDVTYSLGKEVYDPATNHYYRALQDGFSGQPVSNDAFWEIDRCLVKSLTFLNPGDTPIAELLGAWDKDPRTNLPAPHRGPTLEAWTRPDRDNRGPWPLGFYLTPTGAQFDPHAPNVVFVRFRLPPPKFTIVAWNSATAYQPGCVVYLAPDCWLAIDVSTNVTPSLTNCTKWRIQNLPELMEDPVKRWAKAEWLSGEGQDEKAVAIAGAAQEDLDAATATISDQQGQTRRYGVATRSTSGGLYRPRRTVH